MARTLVASDNFDSYSDTSNLGDAANWLELNGATGLLRVANPGSAGRIYEPFNARSECRWDGSETFSATGQYSKATLTNYFVNADTTKYMGACCFMTADTTSGRDYYAALAYDGLNTAATATEVIKVSNDTVTTLYTKATGDNWANGDTLELEAIVNGGSVDLKVYKNGSLLRTVTDSSSPLSGTSTKPGISGKGGDPTTQSIAAWEGGDVTTGGSPVDVALSGSAGTSGSGTQSPAFSIGL